VTQSGADVPNAYTPTSHLTWHPAHHRRDAGTAPARHSGDGGAGRDDVHGTVDSIMVGHYSAVALGNMYFFGLAIFGIGVLMVLDPVVAQAVGAKDEPAVTRCSD
jgi:hypothetical protein